MTETAKDKTATTYTLDFAYDAQGTPYSLTVTMQGVSLTYYYITNLQGDVVSIIDASKNKIASYDYDPYGRIVRTYDYSTQTYANIPTEPEDTTKTLADLNPLRYRGYYYDNDDVGFYYLQSRYYDATTCRFISADSIEQLGTNNDFTSLNLFVYCGNEPVMREDNGGTFWFVSVIVGVATQYVGDVVGNLLKGKTGLEVFKPTSSVGEYIAAGVTALIPGSGLGGAFVRNVVTEGIRMTEKAIKGQDIDVIDSVARIGSGTILDAGFEKMSDKVTDWIGSKSPKNYSSYAHTARKSKPSLTRQQIYRSMRRSIRFNRVATKTASVAFDVARACLPY